MRTVVAVVILLSISLLGVLSYADEVVSLSSNAASLYYKKVSGDLSASIEDKLAKIRATFSPAMETEGNNVRSYIQSTDINRMMPLGFDKAGYAAAPAIADLLTASDAKLRAKAVVALGLSLNNTQSSDSTAVEDDALRAALLRRSLLDNSPEVRVQAINAMKRMAFARLSKIPDDINVGLKEATNDPDPQLKSLATQYVQWIQDATKDMQNVDSNQ